MDTGDKPFGNDERTGLFELPGSEAIAHDRIERDFERRKAVQKIFLGRFE